MSAGSHPLRSASPTGISRVPGSVVASSSVDRPLVYCIVPRHLAEQLHEALDHHLAADPRIEVVIQHRQAQRRKGRERRILGRVVDQERRVVRAWAGRRVGDRRAPAVAVDPPVLPRLAASYVEELEFVERVQPDPLWLEDADTARLLGRVQAGEASLFAELYLRYYARVYAYLEMTLADSYDAEDLAQEVFIHALKALPRYERRDVPFRAWLFRIVRNLAINRLEQRRRLDVRAPETMARQAEAAFPDDLLDSGERELVAQLQGLPHLQRQVLVLRYLLDFTASEIGQVVGRSPEAVRQLHQRAMSALRQRLTTEKVAAPQPIGHA